MTVFDDLKDQVITPTTLLRLVPFMGWGSILLDLFQSWGVLRTGMEVSLHLAPGLVQGDSFSDAFMADYGTRIKIASGTLLGLALAGAGSVLPGALGAGTPAAIDEAIAEAKKKLGDEVVDRIKMEIETRVDREINQAYQRTIQDPAVAGALADLRSKGLTRHEDLEHAGVDPTSLARRLGIRQDVAAMAIDTLLHEHTYGLSAQSFDPATGAAVQIIAPGRSDGRNSAWALIDLLDGQKAGLPPDQIRSLEEDFERASQVDQQPGTSLIPSLVLIEILRAQQRDASPDYVKELEDKYDLASRSPQRSISIRRIMAKRGARLGHLAFAPPPSVSFRFGTPTPPRAPPDAPVIRGLPQVTVDGTMRSRPPPAQGMYMNVARRPLGSPYYVPFSSSDVFGATGEGTLGVNSQTPGSNTLFFISKLAEAGKTGTARIDVAKFGGVNWTIADIQKMIVEARSIEDASTADPDRISQQLEFAVNRAAPATIISALQQKLQASRLRPANVILDSRTLARALADAERAGASETVVALELQLQLAVANELAAARNLPADPVSRFLQWQNAIVTGAPPALLNGIQSLFNTTNTPVDSTLVNNAFLLAVQMKASDPLLGRLKTLQRDLLASDLVRARQAAASATTDKRRAMLDASIQANSPPQLIELLRQLHAEGLARDQAAAASAAILKTPADVTKPRPASGVSPSPGPVAAEPSKLRQLGVILLLLSPAIVPIALLNLKSR